eukprot:scaffold207536_cov51-Attheya_sp.AAC.1
MGDDEDRYAAMVEFLGCFPTVSGPPPEDIADLGDGVVLFEALSEIAPSHFDSTTIARHLDDNWALKSSNLRKLLRNLENYYHDVLHKDADFESCVASISAITRDSDREAIAGLFELVAAAAVTCENKGEFVGHIMNMSPDNQVQMKGIIQNSLARLSDHESTYDVDSDGFDDGDDSVNFDEDDYEAEMKAASLGSPMNELSGLFKATENELSSLADMDGLLDGANSATAALKERDELKKSLQDVRKELAAQKSQSVMAVEDSENAQKKLRALAEDLQERLGKRQDELTKVEDELLKTKRAFEDADGRAIDLEEKNKLMADDLDVSNAKALQLRKAEATVFAYRKKLEGVGVMNQQMTEMEDQSAMYLRQIMDLEADVKKVPGLQKSVDELQSQVAKLEKEKVEVEETLKVKSNDMTKLKTQLTASESGKKMYEEELAELQAQLDDDDAIPDEVSSPMAGMSLTSAKSVTDSKEKAMRLQIENRKLREQVETLKKSATGEGLSAAAAVAASAGGVEGESGTQLKAEVTRLKQELQKKEAEKEKLGSDKEKLEAYTKRTLSKFQEKYLVALQECKAKLKEKHDKIEALEMRSASEKTAQKREERLLSSTIYELGLAIMQQRLKER